MLPVAELHNLKKRLTEKNREITIEIELLTAWIQEHREAGPHRNGALLLSSGEQEKYQSWRKVSCRLHQTRSELKAKQEIIRTNLLAVSLRIEEMETCISEFPFLFDTELTTDSTSADACA